MMRCEMIIGHRGYAGCYPENTMISLRKAYEYGAEALEFDVAMSKDGVVFVMHDDQVDRTTNGKGWCSKLTWPYLSKLDAGSYFDSRFAGEKIPRLDEVLDFFNGRDVFLVIELKDGFPGLAEVAARMIETRGMEAQCYLISFNWDYLDAVKKINRCIRTGLVGEGSPAAAIPAALAGGHEVIDFSYPTEESVRVIHEAGLEAWTWTVDSVSDIKKAIEIDLDAITSNNLHNCLPVKQSFRLGSRRPSGYAKP